MANPNPKTDQIKEHQIQPAEVELGRVVGTRYPLAVQAVLDNLPEKQDFIRRAVAASLPIVRPEAHLQTLAALNPKECSFKVSGKLQYGTIAAVLVDWQTGSVKAVLINTETGQVQIPLAKVTILL